MEQKMKKQWISVKCGLSRDPKHRQQMGESVWLFLHMLDRADWETGKVMEWKDEAEADDMNMPVRTLREHRRKLEELEYISCAQKQYGQEITIHNWTNPREYSGIVTNKKQGGKEVSPQDGEQGYIQDDAQGYIQGNRKHVTPTLDSKESKESNNKETFLEFERLKAEHQGEGWEGREIFLPDDFPLVDWYHKVTGQTCPKSKRKDWFKAVTLWRANKLTVQNLQDAYDMDIKWRGVFTSPNQLTEKAIALKLKPVTATTQTQATPKAFSAIQNWQAMKGLSNGD
jgi:hypothetical protein